MYRRSAPVLKFHRLYGEVVCQSLSLQCHGHQLPTKQNLLANVVVGLTD